MPKYAFSAAHEVNDPSYPLHGVATVSIKPDIPVLDDMSEHLIILRTGGEQSVRSATRNGEWIQADFGDPTAIQRSRQNLALQIHWGF